MDTTSSPVQVTPAARSIEIRLDGESGEMEIWVLNPDRLRSHGFGAFLEGYDPAEIGITDDARAELLSCPYRGSLMEIEFFNHPVIGYCSRRADMSSVSVHGDGPATSSLALCGWSDHGQA